MRKISASNCHRGAFRTGWVVAVCSLMVMNVSAADDYDAAVAHSGRTASDIERDAFDHPAEILRLAGIKPGMHVADILAGSGYYSELLSYLVGPAGKVYLINNAAYDQWSAGLEARLASSRLSNVEHDTIDLNHMNLQDNSLDAIFLIKVYHDLYWKGAGWPIIDADGVVEQIQKALRPGGRLLLIDHSAKEGTGPKDAQTLHRMDEPYAIEQFARHGLRVVGSSDLLKRRDDPRDRASLDKAMSGRTDRFVLLLRKDVSQLSK